jgi:hypothetical protein
LKAVRRLAGKEYDDALAQMATTYPLAEYLAAIGGSPADGSPPTVPKPADVDQSSTAVPFVS